MPRDLGGTVDELRERLGSLSVLDAAPKPRPIDIAELQRAIEGGADPSKLLERVDDEPERHRDISRRYLGVSTAAEAILMRLPIAVLDAYRSRYGAAAASVSARRGDEALEDVARLYPLTDAGLGARELLADRAFEAGRFHAARTGYDWLLGFPWSDAGSLPFSRAYLDAADRARIGAKLLLATRRSGRRDLWDAYHEALVDELAAAAADDGRALRARIARIETIDFARAPRRPGLPGGLLERSWESFGWSDDVRLPRDLITGRRQHPGRVYDDRGIDFPFVPLAFGDSIFLSGVRSLYRLDGRPGAGKILQEIRKPPPLLRGFDSLAEDSDSPLYTVVMWDRSDHESEGWTNGLPQRVLLTHWVSTRVRYQHYMGYDITVPLFMRSLVAYDERSGAFLWRTRDLRRTAQRDPFGPNQVPVDISYTSAPIVYGDLVIAGGWREEGYVDGVVRGLDLRTGETVWETPVGSAQMEQTMFGELAREPFASFLVEREGTVYYQSNLGTVAALDAGTGDLLWATAYDYVSPDPTALFRARKRSLVWGLHPPVFVGHQLIVAPKDSEALYAIDTGTGPAGPAAAGRLLWWYDNPDGALRARLGHHRDKRYFTGDAGVAALDLSTLRPSGELDLDDRAQLERDLDDVPVDAVPEAERVVARYPGVLDEIPAAGLLTRRGVLAATESGLTLIGLDLATRHSLIDAWPPSRDGYEYAGRVRIAGGLVIVVGRRLITAFGGPLR